MSEFINLSDNWKLLLPIIDLMSERNYPKNTVKIEQDNKSTISLSLNGRGNSSKSAPLLGEGGGGVGGWK